MPPVVLVEPCAHVKKKKHQLRRSIRRTKPLVLLRGTREFTRHKRKTNASDLCGAQGTKLMNIDMNEKYGDRERHPSSEGERVTTGSTHNPTRRAALVQRFLFSLLNHLAAAMCKHIHTLNVRTASYASLLLCCTRIASRTCLLFARRPPIEWAGARGRHEIDTAPNPPL